ncbi:hypothetical protein CTI12_AA522400 [Artemisia annua]|uniref:FHA domain-containing protein n=1 Tax=Artemisia annua TaxID=35608 RepID=A0A2U1L673_ARTAN|nr:hypothetical protein CTI12_AA522400 [Artemisia annua]
MVLESRNGSKITLQKNPNTAINLARNSLSQTPDKTVSRHHITLNYNTQKGILKFVVYGKNPIWVHEFDKRHHIILNYNTQKGILNFVVYGKNPIWVHEFHKDEIKVYRRGTRGK